MPTYSIKIDVYDEDCQNRCEGVSQKELDMLDAQINSPGGYTAMNIILKIEMLMKSGSFNAAAALCYELLNSAKGISKNKKGKTNKLILSNCEYSRIYLALAEIKRHALPNENVEENYKQAAKHIKELYQKALQYNKENVDVYKSRASYFHNNSDMNNAINDLEKVWNITHNTYDMLNLAACNFFCGRFDVCERLTDTVLKTDVRTEYEYHFALIYKAKCRYFNRDIDGALIVLSELRYSFENSKNNTRAFTSLYAFMSKIYLETDNIDMAINLAEKAVSKNSCSWEAQLAFAEGIAAKVVQNPESGFPLDKIEKMFMKAFDLATDKKVKNDILISFADACERLGRYEMAESVLKMISDYKKSLSSLISRCMILTKLKCYDEALSDADEGIRVIEGCFEKNVANKTLLSEFYLQKSKILHLKKNNTSDAILYGKKSLEAANSIDAYIHMIEISQTSDKDAVTDYINAAKGITQKGSADRRRLMDAVQKFNQRLLSDKADYKSVQKTDLDSSSGINAQKKSDYTNAEALSFTKSTLSEISDSDFFPETIQEPYNGKTDNENMFADAGNNTLKLRLSISDMIDMAYQDITGNKDTCNTYIPGVSSDTSDNSLDKDNSEYYDKLSPISIDNISDNFPFSETERNVDIYIDAMHKNSSCISKANSTIIKSSTESSSGENTPKNSNTDVNNIFQKADEHIDAIIPYFSLFNDKIHRPAIYKEYVNEAIKLMLQGKYSEATQKVSIVYTAHRNFPEAYFIQGNIFKLIGNHDKEACTAFELCIYHNNEAVFDNEKLLSLWADAILRLFLSGKNVNVRNYPHAIALNDDTSSIGILPDREKRRLQVFVMNYLSEQYYAFRKYNKVFEIYDELLPAVRELGMTEMERSILEKKADTYMQRGLYFRQTGNEKRMSRDMRSAIGILDELLMNNPAPELQLKQLLAIYSLGLWDMVISRAFMFEGMPSAECPDGKTALPKKAMNNTSPHFRPYNNAKLCSCILHNILKELNSPDIQKYDYLKDVLLELKENQSENRASIVLRKLSEGIRNGRIPLKREPLDTLGIRKLSKKQNSQAEQHSALNQGRLSILDIDNYSDLICLEERVKTERMKCIPDEVYNLQEKKDSEIDKTFIINSSRLYEFISKIYIQPKEADARSSKIFHCGIQFMLAVALKNLSVPDSAVLYAKKALDTLNNSSFSNTDIYPQYNNQYEFIRDFIHSAITISVSSEIADKNNSIALLNIISSIEPEDSSMHFQKSRLNYQMGNYREASENLICGIESSLLKNYAVANLNTDYYKICRYRQAIERLFQDYEDKSLRFRKDEYEFIMQSFLNPMVNKSVNEEVLPDIQCRTAFSLKGLINEVSSDNERQKRIKTNLLHPDIEKSFDSLDNTIIKNIIAHEKDCKGEDYDKKN